MQTKGWISVEALQVLEFGTYLCPCHHSKFGCRLTQHPFPTGSIFAAGVTNARGMNELRLGMARPFLKSTLWFPVLQCPCSRSPYCHIFTF